ncbi:hypothetical protein HME9302_00963 [Alteripontixanthobacter maritimus]|uniref:VRR-NUC domain-containing protein n=1 Tax=Alteripontixanthobacter maritimus TaxID=2161824 RepID=A0A369QBY6_9SPHN|nr:VRR-NUC domain-containing protein [Alteripontixanthobacter maritimus]RDC59768.1 hypothetical protein HME9302_00963 [Alteripontixanthobacter maritimus]
MIHAESIIQKAMVKHIRAKGLFVCHVPNGGKLPGTRQQKLRTGARLKAEGLVAGFPDLVLYGPEGRVGMIEVKAEGKYQQPNQKTCQAALEALGHRYAVCRSNDDVDETLSEWGWA